MNKYIVNDGICKLGFNLSFLERNLIRQMEDILDKKGYHYLSIPSSILVSTLDKQGTIINSLGIDDKHMLGGSAEQGILEYFSYSDVKPMKLYATNQCFRVEDEYEDLIRCKEFRKVEQFAFCKTKEQSLDTLNEMIDNAIILLTRYDLKYRVRNMTYEDIGYHKLKFDIEVLTKKYGWLETHSATYFGEEQTKRFGIRGATHTISCTGVALPRLLIPMIEKIEEE